eukprot:5477931-Pyramimonas_sp.AAC.1
MLDDAGHERDGEGDLATGPLRGRPRHVKSPHLNHKVMAASAAIFYNACGARSTEGSTMLLAQLCQ